jgi:hypothetical protein
MDVDKDRRKKYQDDSNEIINEGMQKIQILNRNFEERNQLLAFMDTVLVIRTTRVVLY